MCRTASMRHRTTWNDGTVRTLSAGRGRGEERLEPVRERQRPQHAAARRGTAAQAVAGARRADRRRRSRDAPPGTRRRPARSPRARSNRWRRRGVRLAGRPPRRAAAARAARAASAGQVALRCRRQRMSGSRRMVPRPEHGASTSTRSNAVGEGQRAVPLGPARRATCRAPLSATVSRSSASRRGRTSQATMHARVAHVGRQRRRLAAGRRAEVEHAFARPRADHQRHQLRRLVLHEEDCRRAAAAAGCPSRHDQAVRRVPRRLGLDFVGGQRGAQSLARRAAAGWRAASAAASSLLNCTQRSVASKPMPIAASARTATPDASA